MTVSAGEGARTLLAAYNSVSPEYFGVFEIPILRGRNFTGEEADSDAPVAILSQATARQLWPNGDALGQSLRLTPDPPYTRSRMRYPAVRVIALAKDVTSGSIGNGVDKTLVYFPTNRRAPRSSLLVRVHGDPEAARRRLDADLTGMDPTAVGQIHKMQEVFAAVIYPSRVAYWVSSAIGVLALLLTLSGIYGVLSYVVSQRTKEIGIRMAIGATTRSVKGLVMMQSLRLGIIGIAVGGVLALGVSRIFASSFGKIDTFDGAAYAGGILLVLAACAAAAYVPSRRAARIDPIKTLRYD